MLTSAILRFTLVVSLCVAIMHTGSPPREKDGEAFSRDGGALARFVRRDPLLSRLLAAARKVDDVYAAAVAYPNEWATQEAGTVKEEWASQEAGTVKEAGPTEEAGTLKEKWASEEAGNTDDDEAMKEADILRDGVSELRVRKLMGGKGEGGDVIKRTEVQDKLRKKNTNNRKRNRNKFNLRSYKQLLKKISKILRLASKDIVIA